MGIAELWELSLLLLHVKLPAACPPSYNEFELVQKGNKTTSRRLQSELQSNRNNNNRKVEGSISLLNTLSSFNTSSIHRKMFINNFNRQKRRKRQNLHRLLDNRTGQRKKYFFNPSNITVGGDNRANSNVDYVQFKQTAQEKFNFELKNQNALDVELYQKALFLMCKDLHRLRLWDYEIIRVYWRRYTVVKVDLCS